jgi:hypothetical protein
LWLAKLRKVHGKSRRKRREHAIYQWATKAKNLTLKYSCINSHQEIKTLKIRMRRTKAGES